MDACNNCCKNKPSAFDIMYRFKCSREIMTDRRNGLLQLMPSDDRLPFNLSIPETKDVSWLITMISSYYNSSTAQKMSKYGVISGPYFPVFRLNTEKYGPEITHSVFGYFSRSAPVLEKYRKFERMCAYNCSFFKKGHSLNG